MSMKHFTSSNSTTTVWIFSFKFCICSIYPINVFSNTYGVFLLILFTAACVPCAVLQNQGILLHAMLIWSCDSPVLVLLLNQPTPPHTHTHLLSFTSCSVAFKPGRWRDSLKLIRVQTINQRMFPPQNRRERAGRGVGLKPRMSHVLNEANG